MNMNVTCENWLDIGTLEDIPLRGARCVQTPQMKIGVFRTADNQIYAIEDQCPHKAGPLTQGIVHGESVTCPLHNWVISLKSGEAQGADEGKVRTIAARVVDGRLQIRLPQPMLAEG